MEEIFRKISEQWFLSEPAYFALYCRLRMEANSAMQTPLRAGKGMIEYNPALLAGKSIKEIEQLLRIELIRIFLKHPYERQPENVGRAALSFGSDVTVADSYDASDLNGSKLPLLDSAFFKLPEGKHFEWYSREIDKTLPDGDPDPSSGSIGGEGQSGGNAGISGQMLREARDKSALWQEDPLRSSEINDLIQKMSGWGSIPGQMVQEIIASTRSRIDYRLIMQGFRGSILSSKASLTRMKPNRRTGFDQMGTKRSFTTRLLVAVDVSGSIDDASLRHFYGVILRMFRYGIGQIDTVQFDAALGPVRPLRKAPTHVEIVGRGGTNFQPIFHYLKEHNIYDGLIILTDGNAAIPKPDETIRAKVLWVCKDENAYLKHEKWMSKIGRACWMYL